MELIRLAPDIGTGARDFVLPSGSIKFGGSLEGRRADVIGIREAAELSTLCENRSG
jgi:hypothetical protein